MHLESSNVMFEGTLWLDRNTAQIGGERPHFSCLILDERTSGGSSME